VEERLYCQACAENTIASYTQVKDPERTAPCDQCYERLKAIFHGSPMDVLARMLTLKLVVMTDQGGFDFTELGAWVWADVIHDKRTPDDIRRTMLGVLVRWGSSAILQDILTVDGEFVFNAPSRTKLYALDVQLAMEYAGELAPPVEPEKETA